MPAIEAVGEVPAAREEVFAFLASLPNHWALANRWIEVIGLQAAEPPGGSEPNGGVFRIRGPLGLHRTARTEVLAAEPPARISGRAELPGGTAATVTWSLEEASPGTRVRLAASRPRARWTGCCWHWAAAPGCGGISQRSWRRSPPNSSPSGRRERESGTGAAPGGIYSQ